MLEVTNACQTIGYESRNNWQDDIYGNNRENG